MNHYTGLRLDRLHVVTFPVDWLGSTGTHKDLTNIEIFRSEDE